MWAAYGVVRRTFGVPFAPLVTVWLFFTLRAAVAAGMALDVAVSPRLRRTRVRRPIVLVGNPRTGTTFLQRFLCEHKVGAGAELWRMLYPSLVLQTLLSPFLPLLERISPARHHSTVAHDTSLTSVETDDVSVLFRYFDGFFLYGFFLAFSDEDLRREFEPDVRDNAERDFAWLERLWRRSLVAHDADRVVAKLFSVGPRLPRFLESFPDAAVLYMARDPVEILPSAMSLVTGVLDKRFGFWRLPEDVRKRYLERLYQALVELLRRFEADWTSGRIDRTRVYVVRYDRMMAEFEVVMDELLRFAGHVPDAAFQAAIDEQARKQRAYKSKHGYDLAKFGLDADRIRADCKPFIDTFLQPLGAAR
jgi:hypothetical protein